MTNFSLISLRLYVTAACEFARGGREEGSGGLGGGTRKEAVWALRLLTFFISVLHCQQYLLSPNTARFQVAAHGSYVIKAKSGTAGEIFASC